MKEAFICEGIRTPIEGLEDNYLQSNWWFSSIPLKYLKNNLSDVEWDEVDEVFGNANQAGEDNRNIARMALLLAGFSEKSQESH